MAREKLSFAGADGHMLDGALELPDDGEPRAYALFAHCFTGSKDVVAATRIATALARQGIAVLRFDFTGLGDSEGDFANTTFSSNVGDLVAAADHLRATRQAPAILIGHSLGGAAVLAAAPEVPEAVAVCTVNAPAEPEHVTHLFAEQVPEIEAAGEAAVTIGGRDFRIKKEFLEDIMGRRLRGNVRRMEAALLIFHAPEDAVVDIDNARHIFKTAHHPKSFVALAGADHMLTRRADGAYVAAVLAAWAGRYI